MVANVSHAGATPKPPAGSVPLRDQCIHELFEAQAARTPHATALLFEGKRLTYRQLSVHSARFARRLHALGVRRGSFVALYAPRSLETIISLLGILKAGGAYVALDMESPADRIALMLSDLQPAAILTLHPLAGDLPLKSDYWRRWIWEQEFASAKPPLDATQTIRRGYGTKYRL
jgi:non-ribosomal peptide synthetase component F